MPWFAVYYVPAADTDLHRLGSSVLGYDSRAGQRVPLGAELAECVGSIDDEWVASARGFGLHMTISDLYEFDAGDLAAIEREIEEILECFDPEKPWKLSAGPEGPVSFRGGKVLALRYQATAPLLMLHALMVTRMPAFSTASVWQQRYLQNPSQYGTRRSTIQKIRKFGTLNGLDTWSPHLTLLNPYPGQDHERLVHSFSSVFGRFTEITVGSVCLLLQKDEGYWHVWREFPR